MTPCPAVTIVGAAHDGAHGRFVMRDTLLVAAVEGTVAGKTHIDPAVAGQLLSHIAQGTPTPPSRLLSVRPLLTPLRPRCIRPHSVRNPRFLATDPTGGAP